VHEGRDSSMEVTPAMVWTGRRRVDRAEEDLTDGHRAPAWPRRRRTRPGRGGLRVLSIGWWSTREGLHRAGVQGASVVLNYKIYSRKTEKKRRGRKIFFIPRGVWCRAQA
jgi:hypothetical protein